MKIPLKGFSSTNAFITSLKLQNI